ncbi:hypothetical protein [Nocardiopsis alba]
MREEEKTPNGASSGSPRSDTFHGPTAFKVGGSGDQYNYFGIAPPGPEPLGTPLEELTDSDASRLQVHTALEVGDSRRLPPLPPYLLRPHFDDRLRDEVRAAAEGSRMVMVVGGSSTGKTRACWEALKSSLPEGWRLWHPLTPDRPQAVAEAIDKERVGPRTVIWLDEAQMYLSPRRGEGKSVPEALQRILSSPRERPVLVLGSLWPEYWDALVNSDDESTRLFLERVGVQEVRIPDTFVEAELEAGKDLVRSDTRLMWAVEHAAEAGLTQTLAGGPFLIRRYERETPEARAIIEAAMDVARLGEVYARPGRGFLRAAAPGYLTERQAEALPKGWFDEALGRVMRPERGISGLLKKVKSPGASSWRFHLADYLEQYGRESRRHLCPPMSFWEALKIKGLKNRMPGKERFAEEARRRMRFQQAETLYRAAGDDESLEKAARIRWAAGDRRKVEQDAVTLAWRGRTDLLWEFARDEFVSGNEKAAIAAYRLGVELNGPGRPADELGVEIPDEDTERFIDLLVEVGEPLVLEEVADRLRYAEAWDVVRRCRELSAHLRGLDAEEAAERVSAERWEWRLREERARIAAERDDLTPLSTLLEERYDDHFPQAFLRGIHVAKELGEWGLIFSWIPGDDGFGIRDGRGLSDLVKIIEESTDVDRLDGLASLLSWEEKWEEVERLTARLLELSPNTVAVKTLVKRMMLAGRPEAAERICDRAKDNPCLVRTRVLLLLRRGEWEKAEELALSSRGYLVRRHLDPLIDRRLREGEWGEAERMIRLRLAEGYGGQSDLVDLLRRQGRDLEAASLLREGFLGDPESVASLARIVFLGDVREVVGELSGRSHGLSRFVLVLSGWCFELAGEEHKAEILYRSFLDDFAEGDRVEDLLLTGRFGPRVDEVVKLGLFARRAGDLDRVERVRSALIRHCDEDLPAEQGVIGWGNSGLSDLTQDFLDKHYKELSADEFEVLGQLTCSDFEVSPLGGVCVWGGRLFQLKGMGEAADAYYALALELAGARGVDALTRAHLQARDFDRLMGLVDWAAARVVRTSMAKSRLDPGTGTARGMVVFQRSRDAGEALSSLLRLLVVEGEGEWSRETLRCVRSSFGEGGNWSSLLEDLSSEIVDILNKEGFDAVRRMVELLAEFDYQVDCVKISQELDAEGDRRHAELFRELDSMISEGGPKGFSRLRSDPDRSDDPEQVERSALQAADAGDSTHLEELARRRVQEDGGSDRWNEVLSYGLTPEGEVDKAWCSPRPSVGDVRPKNLPPYRLWPEELPGLRGITRAPLSPGGTWAILSFLGLLFWASFAEFHPTPQAEVASVLGWLSLAAGPLFLPALTADARERWRMGWRDGAWLAVYGILWSPAMIWALAAPVARRRRVSSCVIAVVSLPFTFVGTHVFVLVDGHVGTGPAILISLVSTLVSLAAAYRWSGTNHDAYLMASGARSSK